LDYYSYDQNDFGNFQRKTDPKTQKTFDQLDAILCDRELVDFKNCELEYAILSSTFYEIEICLFVEENEIDQARLEKLKPNIFTKVINVTKFSKVRKSTVTI